MSKEIQLMSKLQRRLIMVAIAVVLLGAAGLGAHFLIRAVIAMHS